MFILFPVIERLIHNNKTEGLTIVITPLISLKNSQINKFCKVLISLFLKKKIFISKIVAPPSTNCC